MGIGVVIRLPEKSVLRMFYAFGRSRDIAAAIFASSHDLSDERQ